MNKRDLKIFYTFIKGAFKKELAYKAETFMWMLGSFIVVIVTYFLWKAIYSSSNESIIKGFTLNEMLIYVLISYIIGMAASSTISYEVSKEVRDGSVAMSITKPISYRKRMIAIGIGEFLYKFILVVIPAMIFISIFGIYKGINIGFSNIAFGLLSIVLAFLINVYYSYMFGLAAFKIYNMWGVSQIQNAIIMLISGSLIPLTFFPDVIGKIIKILPFSSVIYTPSMIYLGKIQGALIIKELGFQLFWVIILGYLSKFIFSKVIGSLSVQGG
ncbi:ABC-2 family transporter protein [Clostridium sp. LY3-2]|uniref:ABC transporter permease n=1 Tax=Clostridium sp. LY3-2 TaxID=2942482 RepID=UPI002152FCE0|nr:ABC-2 family transporter protein [Clostridium sp. LY3-2]MCR6513831.1 ABC-2 family transporter protein [Clostridium sp. LY3-2]